MKKLDWKSLLKVVLFLPVLPILGGVPGESGSTDDDDEDEDDKNKGGEGKGQGEGSEGSEGKNKEDKNGEGSEKKFSQKEVNSMMSKEKKQGRSSILKELGFSDSKSAKDFIEKYRAIEEKDKTPEQKESETNKALHDAEDRATMAEAKVDAMLMGAKPEFVDEVIALAMSKISDENTDFKEIIGNIKTKLPSMFTDYEDDDDEHKEGRKGTGGNPGGKGNGKGSSGASGIGARLAAARNKSASKSSYFKN